MSKLIEKSKSSYLLIDECAEIARASNSTIYHWIATGKLRAHRPGRRVLVRADDLYAFLDGNRR
jgi:excisionase family DNA binding protein